MRIGDETPIRRRLRPWGVLVTGLALLAGVVGSPPLRAAIHVELPEPFDCKVGGRTVEVPQGRYPAHHGDHPWQAALLREGKFTCGGIVLGAEWVLTAAHCVTGGSPNSLAVWHGASDIREAMTATRAVSEMHIHPEFDQSGAPRNDIALLRLAYPFAHARYSHANLPGKGEARAFEQAGTCAVVAGWGRPQTGLSPPRRLTAANVRMMSRKECRKMHGQDDIPAGQICAGSPGTSVTFNGDGGGPLTVGGLPNRPRWLVGVLSWGPVGEREAPDVYTSVAHYLEWIESTMAKPPKPRKSELGPVTR